MIETIEDKQVVVAQLEEKIIELSLNELQMVGGGGSQGIAL